jgi:hypothetical protein
MFDPGQITISNLRDPAAFAANANTTAVDVSQYVGRLGVVFAVGTNTAGTSPTYDAYIQTGPHANGANAVNVTLDSGSVAAITQATGASIQTLVIDKRKCDKYLKVVQAIGGTSSPSFPVSIGLVGTKQTES